MFIVFFSSYLSLHTANIQSLPVLVLRFTWQNVPVNVLKVSKSPLANFPLIFISTEQIFVFNRNLPHQDPDPETMRAELKTAFRLFDKQGTVRSLIVCFYNKPIIAGAVL